MKFGRILAAVAVAGSALLAAPAANADPLVAQQQWKIESLTRSSDVWDQSNWAWDPDFPVIAHESHGGANQKWYISNDGTIKSVEHGWCVTAIDGKLAGRPCGDFDNQKWKGVDHDGYHNWQFKLEGSNRCVTHNGEFKELILTECEDRRQDQRWIISKA